MSKEFSQSLSHPPHLPNSSSNNNCTPSTSNITAPSPISTINHQSPESSTESEHNKQPLLTTPSRQESQQQFWKETQPQITPGRAVMKSHSVGVKSSSSPSKTSIHNNHRRNHSSSTYESFTASCDDAWDSHIEDAVVGSLEKLDLGRRSSLNDSNSGVQNSTVPTTATRQQNSEGYNQIQSNHEDKKISHNEPLLQQRQENHHEQPSQPPQEQSEKSSSPTLTRTKSAPGSASVLPRPSISNTRALTPVEGDPKLAKFKKLVLEDEVTDMNQLRSMAWAGIPSEVRPITWKLLLGYVPVVKSRRPQICEKKRLEYEHLVHQYYNNKSTNDEMWRQIHIDIPRMQPLISIFQQEVVQKMFERILYIWSIRHPASGYVQGMNDLVTPFFVVYLSEFIPGHSLADVECFEVSSLSDSILRGVEADSFWSFSKLLDSIQDNYTFAQPGIQRLVNLLSRVMSRVDSPLHEHLTRHSVQYLQFAFRWMNNLLIRELPLRCIVRLWDTYLSEGAVASSTPLPLPGDPSSSNSSDALTSYDPSPWSVGNGTPFSCSFHLFVCAAFLRFWSKNLLREHDFQGLMLLLQNLPTFHWTENEIKLMVADAYQLKYTFTPNHLNS